MQQKMMISMSVALAFGLLAGEMTPAGAQTVQVVSKQQEQRIAVPERLRVATRIEDDTLTIHGTVASLAEKQRLERELRAFWPDGPVRGELAVRAEDDAGRVEKNHDAP